MPMRHYLLTKKMINCATKHPVNKKLRSRAMYVLNLWQTLDRIALFYKASAPLEKCWPEYKSLEHRVFFCCASLSWT